MSSKPVRGCGPRASAAAPGDPPVTRSHRSAVRGWTLLELVVVVAIIGVILSMSLPSIQNTILVYRLGAAASSVAAAIQQNRYQSVMIGCPYTVAFTAGSTTYEVQTQKIIQNSSSTAPVCETNLDGSPKFTDVTPPPAIISWTSGTGVSLSPSTTFTFTANGIVSATQGGSNCAMPCSFKVSNTQGATRTILVSGVGNVKVTTP